MDAFRRVQPGTAEPAQPPHVVRHVRHRDVRPGAGDADGAGCQFHPGLLGEDVSGLRPDRRFAAIGICGPHVHGSASRLPAVDAAFQAVPVRPFPVLRRAAGVAVLDQAFAQNARFPKASTCPMQTASANRILSPWGSMLFFHENSLNDPRPSVQGPECQNYADPVSYSELLWILVGSSNATRDMLANIQCLPRQHWHGCNSSLNFRFDIKQTGSDLAAVNYAVKKRLLVDR